ncbi:MAG: formylmethanofuran dehydrogenase subunit E family protein [Candidatus Omnitrophota bacterium]
MVNKEILLKKAIEFHGHLGPFLVLGLKAGMFCLNKLKAKKYFGINVVIKGALKKPKSCIIDGLQVSCGATYGKGNIKKISGKEIEILIQNLNTKKKINLTLKSKLIQELEAVKNHKESEILALKLYKTLPKKLFQLKGQ